VEVVPLDLASLESVQDLANRLLDAGRPLDVLINNAGGPAVAKLLQKQFTARRRVLLPSATARMHARWRSLPIGWQG
jgi:short-subunit dehydrogenase